MSNEVYEVLVALFSRMHLQKDGSATLPAKDVKEYQRWLDDRLSGKEPK